MSLLSSNGKGNQKGVKALTGYKTVLRDQNNIFNNLQTTEKGVSRVINHQNTRLLAGMNRLADRGSSKLAQEVQKGHARATNLFGSALGTVVGQNLAPATAAAKGSALTSKATAQAGHAAAAAGAMSFAIEQQAVEAAKASAVYQASAAHDFRKRADQKAKDDKANQASGALLQLAQAGTPYSAITADARALAIQYGLNLAQTQDLVGSVTGVLGYDAANQDSTSATYAPAPVLDQFGQPVAMDIKDDVAQQSNVHQIVTEQLALGATKTVMEAAVTAAFPGNLFPKTMLSSALTMADRTYDRLKAAAPPPPAAPPQTSAAAGITPKVPPGYGKTATGGPAAAAPTSTGFVGPVQPNTTNAEAPNAPASGTIGTPPSAGGPAKGDVLVSGHVVSGEEAWAFNQVLAQFPNHAVASHTALQLIANKVGIDVNVLAGYAQAMGIPTPGFSGDEWKKL